MEAEPAGMTALLAGHRWEGRLFTHSSSCFWLLLLRDLAVENWDVAESAFVLPTAAVSTRPQLVLGSPDFLLGIHLRYYIRTLFSQHISVF